MKEGRIGSSGDPSSSITREEIPVCDSQQIKSNSCWTTCVYLNIIGTYVSVILFYYFILIIISNFFSFIWNFCY
jgi:hypothetical protein